MNHNTDQFVILEVTLGDWMGVILDYNALEEEIKNKRFLGVGLDVFPNESPPENNLKNYYNVVLTPHIG